MKFNWFHLMMTVMLLFVSMLVYFVIGSSRANLDLVTDKYYEEELQFQQKINRTQNANNLTQGVALKNENGYLLITFPEKFQQKEIAGTIKMYYAPDKKGDRTFSLHTANASFKIPIENLKGKYAVQLAWTCDQQEYYTEQPVFL